MTEGSASFNNTQRTYAMLCPSCQRNIPDDTTFCPTCGHKISATPSKHGQTTAQVPATETGRTVSAPVASAAKMTFGGSVKSCFAKYAVFEGRASKAEYWYWYLFTLLIGFAGGLFTAGALTGILCVVTFLPGLAVTTRRLHDSGYSGWNQLWNFTIVGGFYVLYLLLKPTGTEPNKYGPIAPIQ